MKTHIIILIGILLLLQMNSCSSQKQTLAETESLKIDSLLSLYRDSVPVIPVKVMRILEERQVSIQDSVNLYNLRQFITRCLFFNNQLDSAFRLNASILDFCENQPKKDTRVLQLTGNAYNNRGVFLQEINQWDSAIVCMRKAYDALTMAQETSRLPDICINLADCNQHQGHYEWAGFYYRRALFIADSLNQGDKYYNSIYSGLARLYQELENFPLSDSYFQKAEQYWDKGTSYEKYYFANSRGNYYYVTKDYDSALDWFRIANEIVSTFPQTVFKGIVAGNIGEIYLLKEQPDSARYYLDRSVSFLGQAAAQPGVKFYLDGLYASLALQTGDLREASRRLIQPYDTLHTDLQYQFYLNKRLETLFLKKKDYEKAYQYREKADVCNDSLRSVKIRNNITETEFRYGQDTTLLKKDIKIAYVEAKAGQWKWLASVAVLVLVITVLLFVCVFYYIRRKRELRYRKQLSVVTNLRMALVRNRIGPHYIFNVLNSIMPAFRRYEELAEPVRLLIEVLRGDLHSSEQLAIPLEQEIHFVKNYLQLRMMNNPEKIHIEWNIAPETPINTPIPSMSIQIPVENAVKYAFAPNCPDARICITITKEDENLNILIEDNGIGYNPGAHAGDERSTGHGLKILYRTTELLNTHNTRKMRFSIQNLQSSLEQGHGTRVSLIVPLNYNFAL